MDIPYLQGLPPRIVAVPRQQVKSLPDVPVRFLRVSHDVAPQIVAELRPAQRRDGEIYGFASIWPSNKRSMPQNQTTEDENRSNLLGPDVRDRMIQNIQWETGERHGKDFTQDGRNCDGGRLGDLLGCDAGERTAAGDVLRPGGRPSCQS